MPKETPAGGAPIVTKDTGISGVQTTVIKKGSSEIPSADGQDSSNVPTDSTDRKHRIIVLSKRKNEGGAAAVVIDEGAARRRRKLRWESDAGKDPKKERAKNQNQH